MCTQQCAKTESGSEFEATFGEDEVSFEVQVSLDRWSSELMYPFVLLLTLVLGEMH